MTVMHCKPEFNGRSVADSAVLSYGVKGRYKRPLTSQNFICNEKEKRYKRNIMFRLYRFSFIYVVCPAKLDHTSRCKSGHGNRQ